METNTRSVSTNISWCNLRDYPRAILRNIPDRDLSEHEPIMVNIRAVTDLARYDFEASTFVDCNSQDQGDEQAGVANCWHPFSGSISDSWPRPGDFFSQIPRSKFIVFPIIVTRKNES